MRTLHLFLAVAALSGPLISAHADLIDYYTLDDSALTPGGGRTDSSGSALGGGDLVTQNGSGTAAGAAGKIGASLSFPGTLNFVSGGITVAEQAEPFSLSIWLISSVTANATFKALGYEDRAFQDHDNSLAITGATHVGSQVGRNTANGSPVLASSTNSVADGQWHLLTGVFNSQTDRRFYLDGKLTATSTTQVVLWPADATTLVNVGGFFRSTGLVDAFNGSLDDAGFFNNALTAADAALINGLGQTASLGLSLLAPAQSLNGAALGATSSIGGFTWQKVTGLPGVTGSFGGTAAGGDAFIVTDGATGSGIMTVVPEPTASVFLACGFALAGLRRRRS